MLLSYLITDRLQFSWRWLFGAGVVFFILAIGVVSTSFSQKQREFIHLSESKVYEGIMMNMPQEKAKTVACNVYLVRERRQIVCYFQRDFTLQIAIFNDKDLGQGHSKTPSFHQIIKVK